ncbi:MAG: flagellin [Halothiobacillus sp. 14-56-357]|jgi:flagellin|uniref:flagellin N-terminal helical domain-containing protein n=1 Tax=Halothiobacillus sp. 15-55-196 TaxID=1970382 RepID=UPI000BD962B8|nr:flagellin [Halothiobacillus sp. 15-55-196]OZB36059.1 MAG: flagellin [Halothiobacillus sp. 15-55-196]OZB56399.1 MAG: flagellin [Halothiobacillus sp. 14-56-357]OZB73834.1 MAG: flagellin [Halothiobacillus sp. 13-55-115]
MSSVINTNILSLQSQNALRMNGDSMQTAMQRLSTGLRINSAKDDAAGLAITDRMTTQINGSNVAIRNAQDGISMAQTAEGAMGALTSTLQRMRDLAVQSANATNSTSDRQNLQTEFAQLQSELSRIVSNTQFNGKNVLAGGLSGSANAKYQVGANTSAGNQIAFSINNMATNSAGKGGISGVLATGTGASAKGISIGSNATFSKIMLAMSKIDVAIRAIDTSRAKLGAIQNRFQVTIDNLNTFVVNQSSARSAILDTNFAQETSALSKAQILQQAGNAMLTQANQAPQAVLSLLR